jgi:integrase
MLYQRGKLLTWWFRFRFAGRIVHESARTQSKTVAREAEKQRRRQLEESWNQITRRVLPPTFEKAGAEWLPSRQGRVATNTILSAKSSLKHLLPAFGPKLLCDIGPDDISSYQQKRLRANAQGKTINIELGVFRQIMKAHDCWKVLDGKIKSLPTRKDVGRCLSSNEEQRLLTECAKADSACYTAVVIALNTAMRKDEIRRLTWGQVDFFQGVLTVGQSKTAAGTGRALPLNASAMKALADWGKRFPDRQPAEYLFPLGWRKAWRNALKRAGFKVRFHDLRHTAITKMAEGQGSDQTIMSIAGHVSRQMLEHYSHIRLSAKRAALDSIATPLPEPASEKLPIFEGDVHQIGNQIEMPEKGAARKLLN